MWTAVDIGCIFSGLASVFLVATLVICIIFVIHQSND